MQTVSEATFDLFVVPDYVCSGVVEHYVKVSGVITFPHRGTKDIFSVIVNKKTGNLQRQNRVDQFGTVSQMSTIVFGQGYRKCVFSWGMIDLAKLYQTLDDDTKKFLTDAMLSLSSAMYRTLDSDANMTTEEKNGMRLIKECISLCYKDITHGTIPGDDVGKATRLVEPPQDAAPQDDETAQTMQWRPLDEHEMNDMDTGEMQEILKLIQASGDFQANYKGNSYLWDPVDKKLYTHPMPVTEETEETEEAAPPVAEEAAEIARRSVMMARMVNAGAMTDFVNGNIYRFKDNSEMDMNGMRYILLYNDEGEERWVNRSKVDLITVFTEPPPVQEETEQTEG